LVAAKDHSSIQKFIYAASSSTYGDSPILPKKENLIGRPLSPYAVTKLVNEIYADVFSRIYGFHTIGLRYFNVFGPNQSANNQYAAVIPKFIKAAKELVPPTIYGNGENSRDFTYVENVIQANIKAILCTSIEAHTVLNIACGRSVTINELWKLISSNFEANNIKPIYVSERVGDVNHSLADILKAKELFGYEPLFNIEDGISLMKNCAI